MRNFYCQFLAFSLCLLTVTQFGYATSLYSDVKNSLKDRNKVENIPAKDKKEIGGKNDRPKKEDIPLNPSKPKKKNTVVLPVISASATEEVRSITTSLALLPMKSIQPLATNLSNQKIVGPDPFRFTITSNKDSVAVGEEIELTVTVDWVDYGVNNGVRFLPEWYKYALKVVMPRGFLQTGGDYTDYCTKVVDANNPQAFFTIKGKFEYASEDVKFLVLRGFEGADVKSEFVFKGENVIRIEKKKELLFCSLLTTKVEHLNTKTIKSSSSRVAMLSNISCANVTQQEVSHTYKNCSDDGINEGNNKFGLLVEFDRVECTGGIAYSVYKIILKNYSVSNVSDVKVLLHGAPAVLPPGFNGCYTINQGNKILHYRSSTINDAKILGGCGSTELKIPIVEYQASVYGLHPHILYNVGSDEFNLDIPFSYTLSSPSYTPTATARQKTALESASLSATNCSGTVNWSDGGTGATRNVNPSVTTDYTATCTINGCESAPSNRATIRVNNEPTDIGLPSKTYCNTSVLITAIGCDDTKRTRWYLDGGTAQDVDGNQISVPSSFNANVKVYCLSGTTLSEGNVDKNVNITAVPAIPQPTSITFDKTQVTPDDLVTITIAGCIDNTNPSWSINGNDFTQVFTSKFAATTIIYARCEYGTVCSSLPINKSLTVTPANPCLTSPLSLSVVPTDGTCGNSNGQIVATAGGSTQYKFKNGSAAQYPTVFSSDATSTFSNLAAGSYTIFVKDNQGCERSETKSVGVSNGPNEPTDVAGGNNTGPGTINLTASCASGDITWYNVSVGGSSIGIGSTYGASLVTVGDYYYYVSCKTSNCESGRIRATATILPVISDPCRGNPLSPSTTNDSREGAGQITVRANCSTAGSTAKWYASNISTSVLWSGSDYSRTISSTTTFYASCSKGSCETSRVGATATILDISNPCEGNAPATPSVTSGSIEGTGNVNIYGACAGNLTRWYANSSGGSPLKTASSSTDDLFTTPTIGATTTFYAVCINNNGCESGRVGVAAVILPPCSTRPIPPACTENSREGAGSITIYANCNNQTTPSQVGATTRWYDANNNVIGNGEALTVNIGTTTTYLASCVKGNCESSRSGVRATINPCNTPTPSPTNKAICGPGTITLYANCNNNSLRGRWYNSLTSTEVLRDNDHNNNSVSATISSSRLYYTSCVNPDNNCESERVGVWAIVLPTTLSTATNAEVCEGTAINLQATNTDSFVFGGFAQPLNKVSTYEWRGPNSYISTIQNPVIPSAQATHNGIFTSKITNSYTHALLNNGGAVCTATATALVTVYLKPTTGPSFTLPSICREVSGILTANCASPNTVLWYNSASATIPVGNGATYPVLIPDNQNSLPYYADCTSKPELQCNSPRATQVVSPLPAPPAPTNAKANKTNTCIGSSVTLSGSCPAGQTIQWFNADSSPRTILTFSFTSSDLGVHKYYAGCQDNVTTCRTQVANRKEITVTVAPFPAAPTATTASATTLACNSTTPLTFNGTCSIGQTLRWFTNPTGLGGIITNEPGTYDYYLACQDNVSQCATQVVDRIKKTITVTQPPLTVATAFNACAGNSLSLTASGTTTYEWSGPNGFAATGANPIIGIAVPEYNNGIYTITGKSGSVCTATATTLVTVNPAIKLNTPKSYINVCEGGTINLDVLGATTYQWTGPNGYNSVLSSSVITNATVAMSGIYEVIGTTGDCSGFTQIEVKVSPAPTNIPTLGLLTAPTTTTINVFPKQIVSLEGKVCPDCYVEWYEKSTGDWQLVPNLGAKIWEIQKSIAGTYQYKIIQKAGICTTNNYSNTFTLNVVNCADLAIEQPSPQYICENGVVTLSVSTIKRGNNTNFKWFEQVADANGGIIEIPTNVTTDFYQVSYGKYVVKSCPINGTYYGISAPVVVKGMNIQADISTLNSTVTQGSLVKIIGSDKGYVATGQSIAYSWQTPVGNLGKGASSTASNFNGASSATTTSSDGSQLSVSNFQPTNAGKYLLLVSKTIGSTTCVDETDVEIVINPAGCTVDFNGDPLVVCANEKGTITINTKDALAGGAGMSYRVNGELWQSSNVFNNLTDGSYLVEMKQETGSGDQSGALTCRAKSGGRSVVVKCSTLVPDNLPADENPTDYYCGLVKAKATPSSFNLEFPEPATLSVTNCTGEVRWFIRLADGSKSYFKDIHGDYNPSPVVTPTVTTSYGAECYSSDPNITQPCIKGASVTVNSSLCERFTVPNEQFIGQGDKITLKAIGCGDGTVYWYKQDGVLRTPLPYDATKTEGPEVQPNASQYYAADCEKTVIGTEPRPITIPSNCTKFTKVTVETGDNEKRCTRYYQNVEITKNNSIRSSILSSEKRSTITLNPGEAFWIHEKFWRADEVIGLGSFNRYDLFVNDNSYDNIGQFGQPDWYNIFNDSVNPGRRSYSFGWDGRWENPPVDVPSDSRTRPIIGMGNPYWLHYLSDIGKNDYLYTKEYPRVNKSNTIIKLYAKYSPIIGPSFYCEKEIEVKVNTSKPVINSCEKLKDFKVTASKNQIIIGESVTLVAAGVNSSKYGAVKWKQGNEIIGQGNSLSVNPYLPITTYKGLFVIEGDSWEETCEKSVDVEVLSITPLQCEEFDVLATKLIISKGENSVLNIKGCEGGILKSISFDAGTVLSKSISVTPKETKDYEIFCYLGKGTPLKKTVTIKVVNITLTANPTTIGFGYSTNSTLTIGGNCTVSGGTISWIGGTALSKVVSPNKTTTYIAECLFLGGKATGIATVTYVEAPPSPPVNYVNCLDVYNNLAIDIIRKDGNYWTIAARGCPIEDFSDLSKDIEWIGISSYTVTPGSRHREIKFLINAGGNVSLRCKSYGCSQVNTTNAAFKVPECGMNVSAYPRVIEQGSNSEVILKVTGCSHPVWFNGSTNSTIKVNPTVTTDYAIECKDGYTCNGKVKVTVFDCNKFKGKITQSTSGGKCYVWFTDEGCPGIVNWYDGNGSTLTGIQDWPGAHDVIPVCEIDLGKNDNNNLGTIECRGPTIRITNPCSTIINSISNPLNEVSSLRVAAIGELTTITGVNNVSAVCADVPANAQIQKIIELALAKALENINCNTLTIEQAKVIIQTLNAVFAKNTTLNKYTLSLAKIDEMALELVQNCDKGQAGMSSIAAKLTAGITANTNKDEFNNIILAVVGPLVSEIKKTIKQETYNVGNNQLCPIKNKNIDFGTNTVYIGYDGFPIDIGTNVPYSFYGSETPEHEGQIASFGDGSKTYSVYYNTSDRSFWNYAYTLPANIDANGNTIDEKVIVTYKKSATGGVRLITNTFGYYALTDGVNTTEVIKKGVTPAEKVLSECYFSTEDKCKYNAIISSIIDQYSGIVYSQKSKERIFNLYNGKSQYPPLNLTFAWESICDATGNANPSGIAKFTSFIQTRKTEITRLQGLNCSSWTQNDLNLTTMEDLLILTPTCRAQLITKMANRFGGYGCAEGYGCEESVLELLKSGKGQELAFLNALKAENSIIAIENGLDDTFGNDNYTKATNILLDLCKVAFKDSYTKSVVKRTIILGKIDLGTSPNEGYNYSTLGSGFSLSGNTISSGQLETYEPTLECEDERPYRCKIIKADEFGANVVNSLTITTPALDVFDPVAIAITDKVSFLQGVTGADNLPVGIIPAFYLRYLKVKQLTERNITYSINGAIAASYYLGIGELAAALDAGGITSIRALLAVGDLSTAAFTDVTGTTKFHNFLKTEYGKSDAEATEIQETCLKLGLVSQLITVGGTITYNNLSPNKVNEAVDAMEDFGRLNPATLSPITPAQLKKNAYVRDLIEKHISRFGLRARKLTRITTTLINKINSYTDFIAELVGTTIKIKTRLGSVNVGKIDDAVLTLEKNIPLEDYVGASTSLQLDEITGIRLDADEIIYPVDNVEFVKTATGATCKVNGIACFVAGTPVKVGNVTKPIEQFELNDVISAYDHKLQKSILSKVTKLFKKEVNKLAKVIIGGVMFLTTPEHPFFANGHYTAVKDLQKGDSILTQNNKFEVVENVSIFDSVATVYNLEVAEQHNYFIGEAGLLVHNKCFITRLGTGWDKFKNALITLNVPISERAVIYRALNDLSDADLQVWLNNFYDTKSYNELLRISTRTDYKGIFTELASDPNKMQAFKEVINDPILVYEKLKEGYLGTTLIWLNRRLKAYMKTGKDFEDYIVGLIQRKNPTLISKISDKIPGFDIDNYHIFGQVQLYLPNSTTDYFVADQILIKLSSTGEIDEIIILENKLKESTLLTPNQRSAKNAASTESFKVRSRDFEKVIRIKNANGSIYNLSYNDIFPRNKIKFLKVNGNGTSYGLQSIEIP